MEKVLGLKDRWKLYRLNKRRFETNRVKTGKVKGTCTDLFFVTLITVLEEWEVETCLPSHDITDEYHKEWVVSYRSWYWFWE